MMAFDNLVTVLLLVCRSTIGWT